MPRGKRESSRKSSGSEPPNSNQRPRRGGRGQNAASNASSTSSSSSSSDDDGAGLTASRSQVGASKRSTPRRRRRKAQFAASPKPTKASCEEILADIIEHLRSAEGYSVLLDNLVRDTGHPADRIKDVVFDSRHLTSSSGKVMIRFELDVCWVHVENEYGCDSNARKCGKFHICPDFVEGTCSRSAEDCDLGHSFRVQPNCAIVEEHGLQKLSERSLCTLLTKSVDVHQNTESSHASRSSSVSEGRLPAVCDEYNRNGGVCQNGRRCRGLHICSALLFPDKDGKFCTQTSCTLNHKASSPDVTRHLAMAGIDTNATDKEILLRVRKTLEVIRNDVNVYQAKKTAVAEAPGGEAGSLGDRPASGTSASDQFLQDSASSLRYQAMFPDEGAPWSPSFSDNDERDYFFRPRRTSSSDRSSGSSVSPRMGPRRRQLERWRTASPTRTILADQLSSVNLGLASTASGFSMASTIVCGDHAKKTCAHVGDGCPHFHAPDGKLYQWQLRELSATGKWLNLSDRQCEILEAGFVRPEVDEVPLPAWDPLADSSTADHRFTAGDARPLMGDGRQPWSANLVQMTVREPDDSSSAGRNHRGFGRFRYGEIVSQGFNPRRTGLPNMPTSSGRVLQLRRLGAHPRTRRDTGHAQWIWYFMDNKGRWVMYGDRAEAVYDTGTMTRSDISSDDVEIHFVRHVRQIGGPGAEAGPDTAALNHQPLTNVPPLHFKTSYHSYELNFARMVQINQTNGTERDIRRRPAPANPSGSSPRRLARFSWAFTNVGRDQPAERSESRRELSPLPVSARARAPVHFGHS